MKFNKNIKIDEFHIFNFYYKLKFFQKHLNRMKYLVKFIMNCSLLILTLSIFNSKVNTHLLGKTKNFLKSNSTNSTNGTNSTDMLNKFKDFPIRIDLEWTDDNYILNLHFKLIDGKPLQIENGKKNRRNFNDTLHE